VFLLLLVVLPMILIAVLATRSADDAATGEVDVRLFAGRETATCLYEDASRGARELAERIRVHRSQIVQRDGARRGEGLRTAAC
jgi:hypothetical protein